MEKNYLKIRIFFIAEFVFGSLFLLENGGTMAIIDKDIVNAEFSIKFIKLEKEEKEKESPPPKN